MSSRLPRPPRLVTLAAVVLLGATRCCGPAAALSVSGPDVVEEAVTCWLATPYAAVGASGAVTWSLLNADVVSSQSVSADGVLQGWQELGDRVVSVVATDAAGSVGRRDVLVRSVPGDQEPLPNSYCRYGSMPHASGGVEAYSAVASAMPGSSEPVLRDHVRALGWQVRAEGFQTYSRRLLTVEMDYPYAPLLSFPAFSFDPSTPYAGAAADDPAVYPFPTPDRVMADGGDAPLPSRADLPAGTPRTAWPRGVAYLSQAFLAIHDLLRQYQYAASYGGVVTTGCQPVAYDGYVALPGPNWCNAVKLDVFPVGYCPPRSAGVADLRDCPALHDDGFGPYVPDLPVRPFSIDAAWIPTPHDPSLSEVNVTKVAGAPTASQRSAIAAYFKAAGLDLASMTARPASLAGYPSMGDQVVYLLDGTGSPFCDRAAIYASAALARAPYMLNGVLCDALTDGEHPAPVAVPAAPDQGTAASGGCPVGPAGSL